LLFWTGDVAIGRPASDIYMKFAIQYPYVDVMIHFRFCPDSDNAWPMGMHYIWWV